MPAVPPISRPVKFIARRAGRMARLPRLTIQLCALAALTALLTWILASPADALVNPLVVIERQIRKANMLIVLDTSGSMTGVPGGQFQHARGQFPRGQLAKVAFDGGTKIGCWIRNLDRFATEADSFNFPGRLVLVLDYLVFAV